MINLLGKIRSFVELHWNAARTAREVSYLKDEVVYHRGEAEAYYSKWSQAEKVANNRLRHIEKLQKELEDYHYRLDCRFCQTKTVCDNCLHKTGAKSLCQTCGGPGIDLKPFKNSQGNRVNVCKECWSTRDIPGTLTPINTWAGREERVNRKNILAAPESISGIMHKGRTRHLPPGCTNTDLPTVPMLVPTCAGCGCMGTLETSRSNERFNVCSKCGWSGPK